MSDNKKYYYLKLKDNFFDSDAMVVLESMQDGYKYSNILLKLYLRSLKNDGKLMFNEKIPFNSAMLATVTRHSIGDIEKAVAMFKELGLIDVMDNGAIYMSDIQSFIGHGSSEAERKAIYREKIKTDTTSLGHCPTIRPPEIEIEIEIEKNSTPAKMKNVRKALHCNDAVTTCNTEKEKEKEEKRHTHAQLFQSIQDSWNVIAEQKGISKIALITKPREDKIKARLKEQNFLDVMEYVFSALSKLPVTHNYFGNNKNGWKISFDYLVDNGNNYIKVYEELS